MQTMLSGIKPTGRLTLGNYIGAIRQFVEYQDEYEMYIFIANLHAITVAQDPKELKQNTKDLIALYLACGLDSEKVTLFLQSDVHQHAELGWILTCHSYMGELQRMTQYKDKTAKGETGITALVEAAESANAVVAVGSCAVNGGWMAAAPNPAQALGVQQYLKKVGVATPVVNVPGCPVNPEWVMSVLVDVVVMKDMDLLVNRLNEFNMPGDLFNQTIHDNCERRGHFENGEFVYEFGSKEEEMGYCLYPVGCKGPQTRALCGVTLWNNRRSWCVQSGAPCIGCCEANPNNPGDNWAEVNTPFYKRMRDLRIGPLSLQPTTIAVTITGIVAAALVVHGFGMKLSGRMDGGAPFEKIRKWDAKHPDQEIGTYADPVAGGPVLDDELLQKNAEPRNND